MDPTPTGVPSRSLWRPIVLAALVALVVVLLPIGYVGWRIFAPRPLPVVASISPDGAYRCEVHPAYDVTAGHARIVLYARTGDGPWVRLSSQSHELDRPMPRDYSFLWLMDPDAGPASVTVYGLISDSEMVEVAGMVLPAGRLQPR
jgi:hypothetical protein